LGRPARDFQALRLATTSVTGFGARRRMKLQGMLVVAEIAVATVLLLGAGLLIRSFVNLSRVDPGYDPHHLLTFQVNVPTVSTGDARRVLADQVVTRLRELPGVQAVGYAESIPMVRTVRHMPLRLVRDARPGPPPRNLTRAVAEHPDARLVSTDFLTAMGMRVVVGRGFGPNDGVGQPRVLLINQALARTGFLGPSPLGAQVYIIDKTAWEVIGIVDDIRQTGLAAEADPQIFLDFRQAPIGPAARGDAYFAVRTDAPPAIASRIRSVVREVSPQSAVDHIASMDQILSHSLSSPRFFAVLLGLFAAVATALATIGIYGTMAYMATRRTREIGIRIALGARPDQVLRLMLRHGGVMASLGIAAGLVAALPLVRVLRRMLFGVTALDPVTFVAVPVLFLAVATLASYLPTRRAASVDPLRALRTDE
jgi:putative ABC transport system permease protein